MSQLTLIFEGTDFESRVVKARLEDIGLQSMIKSETNAALVSGFGSSDMSSVFVNQADAEEASKAIENFNKEEKD